MKVKAGPMRVYVVTDYGPTITEKAEPIVTVLANEDAAMTLFASIKSGHKCLDCAPVYTKVVVKAEVE